MKGAWRDRYHARAGPHSDPARRTEPCCPITSSRAWRPCASNQTSCVHGPRTPPWPPTTSSTRGINRELSGLRQDRGHVRGRTSKALDADRRGQARSSPTAAVRRRRCASSPHMQLEEATSHRAETKAEEVKRSASSRTTPTTCATRSWRSAPAPAATRPRSSRATSSACTSIYAGPPRLEGRAHGVGNGSEQGGYKDVSFCAARQGRLRNGMRFESGVHRVQRVPKTETQGRIHTSTASSGRPARGGRAVDVQTRRTPTSRWTGDAGRRARAARTSTRPVVRRAPHARADRHRGEVPGRSVPAQEPRDGHAPAQGQDLRDGARQEADAENAPRPAPARSARAGRSEKIRTYNYKEGRVTDHRIKLTLHKLPEILNGELDPILEALRQTEVEERLAAL